MYICAALGVINAQIRINLVKTVFLPFEKAPKYTITYFKRW